MFARCTLGAVDCGWGLVWVAWARARLRVDQRASAGGAGGSDAPGGWVAPEVWLEAQRAAPSGEVPEAHGAVLTASDEAAATRHRPQKLDVGVLLLDPPSQREDALPLPCQLVLPLLARRVLPQDALELAVHGVDLPLDLLLRGVALSPRRRVVDHHREHAVSVSLVDIVHHVRVPAVTVHAGAHTRRGGVHANPCGDSARPDLPKDLPNALRIHRADRRHGAQ